LTTGGDIPLIGGGLLAVADGTSEKSEKNSEQIASSCVYNSVPAETVANLASWLPKLAKGRQFLVLEAARVNRVTTRGNHSDANRNP
jgi:hypothetical protein